MSYATRFSNVWPKCVQFPKTIPRIQVETTRMATDSQSVASAATSRTRETVPCIYCNHNYNLESMFKHIQIKHPREFLQSLKAKKAQFEYPDDPIQVDFEWEDDQDTLQWRSVFGCLASNKTFLTKNGVQNYWKKHPKDAKIHEKEMKKLKSKIRDLIDEEKRQTKKSPYTIGVETRSPDYVRAIYRYFLYLKPRIELIKKLIEKDDSVLHLKEDPKSNEYRHRFFLKPSNILDLIDKHFDAVYKAIDEERIDFDAAYDAYQAFLHRIIPCIQFHYDCAIYVYPKTESNDIGIRTDTIYAAPYFDIAAESDPELDF